MKMLLALACLLAGCQSGGEKVEKPYETVRGQLNPVMDCLFLCVSYCTPKENKIADFNQCLPLSVALDKESGMIVCECVDQGFNIQFMVRGQEG